MEKILGQDEIDALLKGLDSGSVDTAPKEDAPKEGGVTPYNFAGQERVVRGRMAALDIVHDRFIKLLTTSLSLMLRRPVDILVKGTEVVKFGNVISKMPMPSSLIVFKMEPLRGHALLAMDSFLVYLLLDHYFGGNAQTHVKPEGRDFTSIQRRIIRNIATLALVELQKAWQAAQPIRPEIVRIESNPQFAMVIGATELTISIKLTMNLGETERDFFLCYPYSMLEPLKEKLYAGFMSDQFEVDQHWSARFRDEIQHCFLTVEAELGQANIRVSDLMNFALGDVILLDKNLGDPNMVFIEGVPKFLGMPGTLKGQQALQVVSVINPGD